MSVTFTKAAPDSENMCFVCHDLLTENVMQHGEGGELHRVHENCIKQCLKIVPHCPVCKKNVDIENLLPLHERTIIHINFSQWKLAPAAFGVLIGTSLIKLCADEDTLLPSFKMMVVALMAGVAINKLARRQSFHIGMLASTVVLLSLNRYYNTYKEI